MSCYSLKRLADSKLKNLYPEQTCYFKNVVSSGLFCESLTSMADQLLDLYSEYMYLLLCVRFKPCIKILCVASKIFCYNRVHFMLTIKGETGWCYISCVSLVNIAQLLFTFVPAQIETHQSCKPWPRIWSLMHSINCRILFSTRKKKRAVTFQIKIVFSDWFYRYSRSKMQCQVKRKKIPVRVWFCRNQMFIYFYNHSHR